MMLCEDIKTAKVQFNTDIKTCNSEQELQKLQIKYLGRKTGILTNFFKQLPTVAQEERPAVGQLINELKMYITDNLEVKKQELASQAEQLSTIDLTLPGRAVFSGKLHPLTIILNEIVSVLEGMGFEVATGPDIETDYYNFEALNIPENHPARELQDTFYLNNGKLLRTHTSPVQIRVMEKHKPPIRIIAPGRVFRKDTPDATHSPVFHQVEGLYINKDVTLAELKGTLLAFARAMFGPKMYIRFRSGFFPFTEPSVEYDFTCVLCNGKGCSICKGTGWLEISGAGMVDPAVFKFVNYDSEKYTGYAWGMGVERIAILKYQISDIRLFYENDVRFLEQFI